MSQLPGCFKSGNTKIPSIGIGTAYMTSDISEIIYSSIRDGTRLIDTAAVYGSEQGVGKGIKKAIKEGIIDIIFYITTDNRLTALSIKTNKNRVKELLFPPVYGILFSRAKEVF